jgi:hypothetical protein
MLLQVGYYSQLVYAHRSLRALLWTVKSHQTPTVSLDYLRNIDCTVLSISLAPTPSSVSTILTVTLAANGDLNNSTIWENGTQPSGPCIVIVPANLTLTIGVIPANVTLVSLIIRGTVTLVPAVNSTQYVFGSSINILIQSTGSLQSQPMINKLYLLSDSIVTLLSGGQLVGANMTVYSYFSLYPPNRFVESYALTSSLMGPFTIGVMADGTIETYSTLMFFVRQSGSFTSSQTWVGNRGPTRELCATMDNCEITVPRGRSLITAPLLGVLNISISRILISRGASLQLGSASRSGGFRFTSIVTLRIRGTFEYVGADDAGIFLPIGSRFWFFGNVPFQTARPINLTFYTPMNDSNMQRFTLPVGFNSSIFISAASNGSLITTSSGNVSLTFRLFTMIELAHLFVAPDAAFSLNFTSFKAIASGSFDNASIWNKNVVPSGACGIYIPPNMTVTINSPNISANVVSFEIEGTLIIASTGRIGFAFMFPVDIYVSLSGRLIDRTEVNRIFIPTGSAIQFADNATFQVSFTRLFSFTASVGIRVPLGNLLLTSNVLAMNTFAFEMSGAVRSYPFLAYVTRMTGSLTSVGTWLGWYAPFKEYCLSSGACSIVVSSGVSLSTASLLGTIDFPINRVYVAPGGVWRFDAQRSSGPYQFNFPVNFQVAGGLEYFSASNDSIIMPVGSQVSLFTDATFLSNKIVTLSGRGPGVNGAVVPVLNFPIGNVSQTFINFTATDALISNTSGETVL